MRGEELEGDSDSSEELRGGEAGAEFASAPNRNLALSSVWTHLGCGLFFNW